MGDVERATALKDEGNVAFKAADYSKAISLYSRAIATAPQVAALYGCGPLITRRRRRVALVEQLVRHVSCHRHRALACPPTGSAIHCTREEVEGVAPSSTI
jgi:hypothetical protein